MLAKEIGEKVDYRGGMLVQKSNLLNHIQLDTFDLLIRLFRKYCCASFV